MTPGLLYFAFIGSTPDYFRLQTPGFADSNFGDDHSFALATDNRLRLYDAYDGIEGNPGGVSIFNDQHKMIQSFTSPDEPASMALDRHHAVYLGVYDAADETFGVDVFAADSSGEVAPLHKLAGANTQIVYPRALAVDASGTLYVANTGSQAYSPTNIMPPDDILVFGSDARGNTAPARIINGDQTGITEPVSLALGADGNLYVANETSSGYDILVFPVSSNGNVAPIRVLQSTPFGSSIALGTNGEMVLAGGLNSQTHSCFAIYAPGASGTDAPESYPEQKFENRYSNYCGADNYVYSIALEHPWYQP
jgi:hypothetical protein